MKTLKFLSLVTVIVLFFSCSNDDENVITNGKFSKTSISPVVLVKNLYAPSNNDPSKGQGAESGPFTKFDFATGLTTTSDTEEWDIAFRATTIIVNGRERVNPDDDDEPKRTGNAAVYIARKTTFDLVSEVDNSKFRQDEEGYLSIPKSGNGWYTYDMSKHIIQPIADRVLVFKTRDGKYAKVQILSYYYKDAPEKPKSTSKARYYTFNYVYQPNEGVTKF